MEHDESRFVLEQKVRLQLQQLTAEFPSNIDPKVMTKALVELVKKEMPTRNPETEAAKALQHYSPPDSVWAILYGTAMWATLPPLAILAIAYVIGWIGRGFVP